MIVDEDSHYPLLYTLRKCQNPIIRNIKSDILTEEESLSYITNRSNQNPYYELYDNPKLKEFIDNLKIHK